MTYGFENFTGFPIFFESGLDFFGNLDIFQRFPTNSPTTSTIKRMDREPWTAPTLC